MITIGVGILNVLFLNTSSLTGSKTVVTLNYIGYVTFASSNIALFMLLGICCAIHRYDIEDLCTRTKYVPCHLGALRSRRLTPTDRDCITASRAANSLDRLSISHIHTLHILFYKAIDKTSRVVRIPFAIFTALTVSLLFMVILALLQSTPTDPQRNSQITTMLMELGLMLALWFYLLLEAAEVSNQHTKLVKYLLRLPIAHFNEDPARCVAVVAPDRVMAQLTWFGSGWCCWCSRWSTTHCSWSYSACR